MRPADFEAAAGAGNRGRDIANGITDRAFARSAPVGAVGAVGAVATPRAWTRRRRSVAPVLLFAAASVAGVFAVALAAGLWVQLATVASLVLALAAGLELAEGGAA